MVRVIKEIETSRSSDKELRAGKYILLEIGEMMAANEAVRKTAILGPSPRTLYGGSGAFSGTSGAVSFSEACSFVGGVSIGSCVDGAVTGTGCTSTPVGVSDGGIIFSVCVGSIVTKLID